MLAGKFVTSLVLLSLQSLGVNGQDSKWKLQSDACDVTKDQWKLIAWYLERAPYIEVTEIVDNGANRPGASQFANRFVKELTLYASETIRTQTVDFETEELNPELYGWRGMRFQPRANETKRDEDVVIFQERDTFEDVVHRTIAVNRTRQDEPIFGSIVLVECTDLIDDYLIGYPRRPFNYPRANFIIVTYKLEDGKAWATTANRIMSRLWNIYGVLNALIMSTCRKDEIGYFDPFASDFTEHPWNVKRWGVFRWAPIRLLGHKPVWLLHKDDNLNEFPVTPTLFSRYPTALLSKNIPKIFYNNYFNDGVKLSAGFGGFDGLVLGNLAKTLNFKAKVIMPLSGTYGSLQPNNTYSGSLGDVLYSRADISFNGRFIQEYDSNNIEFSFAVNADKMCVIAPAAERIPQWMAIFKCFNVYVWALLPIVTGICGGFWYILKQWDRHIHCYLGHSKKSDLCMVMQQIWNVMLGAITPMPRRLMERILVGSCLMANLIIVGAFQGSLTTSFSTVSYYRDINTLHSLDESGIPIVTSSQSLRTLFGNTTDATPLLRSLIRKYHIFEIQNQIHRTAFKRDICSVERRSDINIIIKTTYQRPDGSAYVHVVEECPRHYFLAYIVKKGWPLLPRVNHILSKFSEAGFLNAWYQQLENAFVVHHLINNRTEMYQTQAFTFYDIQTAFYLLGIGWLLCSIVFGIEVFILPPRK